MENMSLALDHRILILDGAMGTMARWQSLAEKDFMFCDCPHGTGMYMGNCDVLNLTRPDVVAAIHRQYIDSGADIITTNTFNANRISQLKWGYETKAARVAREGAHIARTVADDCHERKIWVAGCMGPTDCALSLTLDKRSPHCHDVDFDRMAAAYFEQASALWQGGADVLLIETCYDARNAQAALDAIERLGRELHEVKIPVMVSATVSNATGLLPLGQNVIAFYHSISHFPLLSFGLNCCQGIMGLLPILERLSAEVSCPVSFHPSAGLPDAQGKYPESPEHFAHEMTRLARLGLVNIVGGCCGTTPAHIARLARAMKGCAPRNIPSSK